MKFYRIFHPMSARGCYSHLNEYQSFLSREDAKYLDAMSDRHSSFINIDRTPCLSNDTKLYTGYLPIDDDKHIFCFQSLEQMIKWFNNEELKHLHKMGFKIAVFECETYNLYQKQSTVPLSEFKECEIISVESLSNVILK